MTALIRTPGALRLLLISVAARLPLAMLSIGVLVHVEHDTGSFAAAGAVAGVLAVAQGVGGPALGRLVDRRGQSGVLLGSAVVAGGALGVLAALPADAPLLVLLLLAAVLGLATPPVGACLRALLPGLLKDPVVLRSAYAVDSAAVELTWVCGPPLVLAVGALWSTGAALNVAGGALLAATTLFAGSAASRSWRPSLTGERPSGGAMRSAGVRTLALVLAGAGLLFGATEVAVTASAEALGQTSAAGLLLGLWGVGGLIGGIAAARLGGGARTGVGLAVLLAALAAGHIALAAGAGNLALLGALIVLAGTMIAPTFATAFAMVDHTAPAGTVTEAFAWLATAVALGTSTGVAAGGAVAEAAGPVPTFVLAGATAAAVAVVAALRADTVTPAASKVVPPSAVTPTAA